MELKFEQIIQNIKNKKFHLIYFLMGEETYFIDQITEQIINTALEEHQKPFNLITFYGKDSNVKDIILTARRYPMMADKMIVVIKEAQDLKNIEELRHYAEKPQKTTILIINYKHKNYDKRKALYKILKNSPDFVVFEAKKLYDYQVPKWITQYLKNKGYTIDYVAIQMLIENIGTELSKLANELEKLTILLPQGTQISPEHIEKNVGISREYNNFELQRAIGFKDYNKAFKIVKHFAENQKIYPLTLTIISLYYYFTKILKVHASKTKDQNTLSKLLGIHPFFVKEYLTAARNYPFDKIIKIIELLRIYDLRVKGVNNASTPSGELLKELIFKILTL